VNNFSFKEVYPVIIELTENSTNAKKTSFSSKSILTLQRGEWGAV
jgi:uncharacterized protein Veg